VTGPGLVVAIDGPAGVGKSTVARSLALRLGVPYLDTGAMYRALALHLIEQEIDPDDREAVAAALPGVSIDLRLAPDGAVGVLLDGRPVEARIRFPEVSAATSRVAVHPEVRTRMVALQRELAARHGGVIEGRDIGTRVLPDAPHKFFFEAPVDVRARRRLADLRAVGLDADVAEVAREIGERDARDREREHSPLSPAPGALVIDTSSGSPEEIVERLVARIRAREA
jgi:cytidylate kinase